MRPVYVIGVHTIKFGKYLEHGIKELCGWTVEGVLKDAGIEKRDLQSAWFSNSAWGMRDFQHCIRGQVALRPLGIDAIPVTNVENACAGGSTAFHGAWKDVASGLWDVSLAVGVEKLYHQNKFATFAGFLSGMDTGTLTTELERLKDYAPDPDTLAKAKAAAGNQVKKASKPRTLRDRGRDYWNQFATFIILGESIGYDTVRKILASGVAGGDHSSFMDVYAYAARQHMQRFGSTPRQLAAIASKNHWHSSLNPNAQYTFELTIEQVLNDRLVSYPLTRSMCAPIGDGAAAAILASEEVIKRLGVASRAVKVRASVLASGRARGDEEEDIATRASERAYAQAGVGL